MQLTQMVYSFLYLSYLLTIIAGIPASIYTNVSLQYLGYMYWISWSFIVLTNFFIVIEGILSICEIVCKYIRKKRVKLWDLSSETHKRYYLNDVIVQDKLTSGQLIPTSISSLDSVTADRPSLDILTSSTAISANPSVLVIIPAYLVNEKDIIESTLRTFKDLYYPANADYNVLLIYNTPDFPQKSVLLDRLELLQEEYIAVGRKLYIRGITNSTSKAENLNHALDLLAANSLPASDYIAIYDADHHPESFSLIKAINLMRKKDADVLQGRCIIYNTIQSVTANIVATEYNLIYLIHHKGGEILRGFGFFGGSNGIWRTVALQEIRFNPQMLTEDIDAGIRALMAGYKIIYSTDVVSYELSPSSLLALIKQRLRWSQGWFQVTIKHSLALLASKNLTVRSKCSFFFLLIYREIFYYVSAQVVPIFVISVLRNSYSYNPWLVLSTMLSFLILPLQLLSVYVYELLNVDTQLSPYLAGRYRKLSWYHHLFFLLASPIYNYIKFLISLLAHIMEVLRRRKWRVTSRT